MWWSVKIKSNKNLSNEERDFIAELINEEVMNASSYLDFILHDIVETKRCSEAIIEGSEKAAKHLVSVLQANFDYTITYKKIN